MNLLSVRVITDDVDAMVDFYARLTGATLDRPMADFAELRTEYGTLAIGHTRTVDVFGPGSASPAANRSAIIEFIVPDVDATYAQLQTWVAASAFVTVPTTMPWGNRALLLRDPDDNLVGLFTPVSPYAVEKFRRYAR